MKATSKRIEGAEKKIAVAAVHDDARFVRFTFSPGLGSPFEPPPPPSPSAHDISDDILPDPVPAPASLPVQAPQYLAAASLEGGHKPLCLVAQLRFNMVEQFFK